MDESAFWETLKPLLDDENVLQMKRYTQHGKVTTYEHCLEVAKACYKHSKGCDMHVLLTSALLHDFYLYDWHQKDDGSHRLHGFHHAKKAADNAKKYFSVDEKTYQCIRTHMWPLNLFHMPRSKEAWVLTWCDKWVSLKETFTKR